MNLWAMRCRGISSCNQQGKTGVRDRGKEHRRMMSTNLPTVRAGKDGDVESPERRLGLITGIPGQPTRIWD
jgi:hypothetical protein